jgi:hypothetical protein
MHSFCEEAVSTLQLVAPMTTCFVSGHIGTVKACCKVFSGIAPLTDGMQDFESCTKMVDGLGTFARLFTSTYRLDVVYLCSLTGVLQVLGKSCLHYAVLPGQYAPDVLHHMMQVPPRHWQPSAEQQADFALFTFTQHLAHYHKRNINAEVVIAGGQE